ncbi:MAG: GDP-mannose 4,6-dehydratase [bacterium]|nr:GDP-mannose 4,6-dehydratase [bacterium]
MKILITGGAGFIGSHTQDKLIELGHEVAILDNFSSGKREYVNPDSKVFEVDLCKKEQVVSMVTEFSPEVVFHLAAQISVPYSMEHHFEDQQVNILGTMNLMEACAATGVKKVIYSNTGGALYGDVRPEDLPVTEDFPVLRPSSFYGVSKACAEAYIKLYANIYGFNWVSLRYANVYGPRQDGSKETGIVAIFTKKLLENEQPTINGSGQHSRDYVFIEDIVEANLKALEYSQNDYFNISSGTTVTNSEVFEVIEGELNTGIKPVRGPERLGDPFTVSLSPQKAKKRLGWEQKVTFQEGVRKTIKYYKKRITSLVLQ